MWICEFTLMVDDVFHDCHRLGDLWEQHQVKSCCANHFHQEQRVFSCHIDLVGIVCHQNDSHAVHQAELDGCHQSPLGQVEVLNRFVDLRFLYLFFQEHHDCHVRDGFVNMHV